MVGPILWSLPGMRIEAGDFQIALFDVPALSDEVMLDCGQTSNFFDIKNLQNFINDIVTIKQRVEMINKISISIILKTKRQYTKSYLKKYFEFLFQLESKKILKIAPPDVNMFDLIASSNLIIAYPFTAPAYVAESLGVQSIYYDPTGEVLSDHFGDKNSTINFVQTIEDLFRMVNCSILSPQGLV